MADAKRVVAFSSFGLGMAAKAQSKLVRMKIEESHNAVQRGFDRLIEDVRDERVARRCFEKAADAAHIKSLGKEAEHAIAALK